MPAPDDDLLRRQAERAAALVEVAQALQEAVTDPRRLTDLVLDRVAHLVGDAVTIWFVPVGQTAVTTAGTTHIDVEARRLLEDIQFNAGPESAEGVTRAVIDTGEPLVIYDFSMAEYGDRIHPAYRPWMNRYGASSLVVLPMRARGRVIGAIGATRDRGRPRYTEFDVDFMQALADIAAVALDNAHLLAEAQDAAVRRDQGMPSARDA
jgi:GAF domain-containing protein